MHGFSLGLSGQLRKLWDQQLPGLCPLSSKDAAAVSMCVVSLSTEVCMPVGVFCFSFPHYLSWTIVTFSQANDSCTEKRYDISNVLDMK